MIGFNPGIGATSTSLLRTSAQPASQPQPTPSPNSTAEPTTGINLNVTRTPDNVSSGDRSQNSATVTLTTPNNEAQVEVTREQAFDELAKRNLENTQQQLLRGTIGEPAAGRGPDPLQQAVIGDIAESDQLNRETAVDLVETRLAFNTAQRALDAFGAPSVSSPAGSDNERDPLGLQGLSNAESNLEFVNQALIAQTKQSLLFSDPLQQNLNPASEPSLLTRQDAIASFEAVAEAS